MKIILLVLNSNENYIYYNILTAHMF